jgi:hypothetical protein
MSKSAAPERVRAYSGQTSNSSASVSSFSHERVWEALHIFSLSVWNLTAKPQRLKRRCSGGVRGERMTFRV